MPQKKSYLVKASLIGKLTKTTGRTFSVVASLSNSDVNLKKSELASFGCKICKSEFAALKGTEPFCVICSSDKVTEIESSTKIENLAKTDESELAAIECSHCHTHNVLSMETAKLLDTKLHCVQCGTEVEYSLDDDTDEIQDDTEDTLVNTDDDQVDDLEDGTAEENDLPNADIVTDDLSEDEDNVDFTEAAEVYDEKLPPAEPEVKIDTAIETKPVSTETITEQDVKLATGDNSIEKVLVNGDIGSDKIEITEEEFPLLQVTSGELEISRIADKIIAFQGGVPVAVLTKANITNVEHASSFHSESFTRAIKHVIKKNGVIAGLATFNFDVTKVKLPVSQVIETRVQEQVTASTESLTAKIKDVAEDFQQCLQLAAVGLNKNYWKGKQNVLKASLIDNLKALNVRNAEKLIASCFAQHSNESTKTLLEVANSLMAKTVEARNELAEAFGEINDIDDEEDFDSENDSETDELESRLETASYSVNKRKPQELVAASVTELASSTRRTHGKLF